MKQRLDPCIARLVPESRKREPRATDVQLFFPHDPVNRDRINCWSIVGKHSEASLDYFRSTVPPRDESDRRVIESAVAEYNRLNPDFPFTLVQKLPKGWEAKAWR